MSEKRNSVIFVLTFVLMFFLEYSEGALGTRLYFIDRNSQKITWNGYNLWGTTRAPTLFIKRYPFRNIDLVSSFVLFFLLFLLGTPSAHHNPDMAIGMSRGSWSYNGEQNSCSGYVYVGGSSVYLHKCMPFKTFFPIKRDFSLFFSPFLSHFILQVKRHYLVKDQLVGIFSFS